MMVERSGQGLPEGFHSSVVLVFPLAVCSHSLQGALSGWGSVVVFKTLVINLGKRSEVAKRLCVMYLSEEGDDGCVVMGLGRAAWALLRVTSSDTGGAREVCGSSLGLASQPRTRWDCSTGR